MRHEYLHKDNHRISFAPPLGYINHVLGLNITNTSHEPKVPKSNHKKPRGSTPDCIPIVPTETCPKSNRQEPVGSTSDRLTLVLKKIHHIRTHNNIVTPFINNTHEKEITKNYNSLHQKYIDITENTWK